MSRRAGLRPVDSDDLSQCLPFPVPPAGGALGASVMPAILRAPTYSVFVRFRQSRLTMRRGIRDLGEAIHFATGLRANRFHDRDNVFVVREPGGEIVDE